MWRPQNILILAVLFSAVILISNATELESLANDPLEVFVVPHSHCDPGWWWSFEEYYNKWTKGIISSIVESLSQDPKRHFIWAEISYFQRWWSDQNEEMQNKARRLISRGQFEFVTGGWVMNDEASVHYVDIINQITEGNEWLHFNFGVKPKISWAIDPFGHSTTMPYLLKEMGFEGVVINRISTPSKTARRDNRELEFYWHQEWQSPKDGLFTHLFPYPYYDIPNTCGPNRDVCETFDFETPKSTPITEANVKERAETLMGQYRQKAKAFKHNKLLIPLGDDFKYKNLDMITHIFTNYERLFKYINDNYDQYKMQIKWSNLTEYFTAAKHSPSVEYPSYFGDFFTYTDRENDFWSGYFTSRPFLKGLIRKTQWLLRNVEQMFVFDYLKSSQNPPNGDENSLVLREARRNMGLAQHHDAITGTARRDPTQDYIRRLKSSFDTLIKSMGDMLSRVLKIGSESISANFMDINKVIDVKNKKMVPIVLYNSLGQEREYVAKATVNSNYIMLKNSQKEDVPFQINFAFDPELTVMPDQYEIHFLARIPPLGTVTFFVVESETEQPVTEINEYIKSESNEVKLHNDILEIKISPEKGTITSMKLNGQEKSFEHKYMQYKSSYKGGAYIFAPQGDATLISTQHNTVTVLKGPLVESALVRLNKDIKYRVNIYQLGDTQDHMEIINTVNLQSHNSELIMRLDSGVKNSNKFVVDRNGLGEIERTTVTSQPIASNYYPLTSGAYIVDKSGRDRLEIITRQPMGVGSLSKGQLEVCLDRRLGQDDGRGLGEPVTDNVRFEIPLFVTWSEHKSTDEPTVSKQSYFINNPPVILYADLNSNASPQKWASTYTTRTSPIQALPNELFLQQFRLRDYDQKVKPNSEIIFRVVNGGQKHSEESFDIKALFEDYSVARASSMSLSLMHTEQELANKKESSKRALTLFDGKSVEVAPMGIKTFLVDLTATFNDVNNNRPTKTTMTPIKGNTNTNGEDGEDMTYWMNKAKEYQKEVKRLEYENHSLKNQFDALQRRFDDAELQHSSIIQMRGLFIFSIFLLALLFILYNRKRVRARSSPYHNNRAAFNIVISDPTVDDARQFVLQISLQNVFSMQKSSVFRLNNSATLHISLKE